MKLLCWIGFHDWGYRVRMGEQQVERSCNQCSVEQVYVQHYGDHRLHGGYGHWTRT